jgi:putative transposase
VPNYRRNYVPGGTYFFTVVTHERRPILTSDVGRKSLRTAFLKEQKTRPFEVVGVVLLPDHLHTVWTLPSGESDYSLRWARIKELFTRYFLKEGGKEGGATASRRRRRERAVWQRRFWEHTCRDEADLKRCLDYLHWNPVKHGLVARVQEYPWSSFHRFVELGEYELAWGAVNPCPGYEEPEWE